MILFNNKYYVSLNEIANAIVEDTKHPVFNEALHMFL